MAELNVLQWLVSMVPRTTTTAMMSTAAQAGWKLKMERWNACVFWCAQDRLAWLRWKRMQRQCRLRLQL